MRAPGAQAGGAQDRAPILDAIEAYLGDRVTGFHTPGGKGGRGLHPRLRDRIGTAALELDLGLMGELDNLFDPKSCIAEALDLAARLWGADRSFYAINGTTCAIQAMIMAAAGPGEKIVIPRNAHRSVAAALILGGAAPLFVMPGWQPDLALPTAPAPADLDRVLAANPDARAALVTSPTYYGLCADLPGLAAVAHARGVPLLVDEAHGAHLGFDPRLPPGALACGADAAAQSTHKLLAAMTQCSMLHLRGGRLDADRIAVMLQLVQTTSANYLLLASLDVARMQMALDGGRLMGRTVDLAERARTAIDAIPGLSCPGAEIVGAHGVSGLDPTKLTVRVAGLGLDGPAAERILRREHRVQAELSDPGNLLFLVTLGDSADDLDRLVEALRRLARDHPGGPCAPASVGPPPPLPAQAMTPREAFFARKRSIPLGDAAGRVSGETITFYPPGIPLVWPGETIDGEVVERCRALLASGASVSGPQDRGLRTVQVVDF